MLKAISAYMRRVGRRFQSHFYTIANGIKKDDDEQTKQGIFGIGLMLLSRVVILVIFGFLFGLFGMDLDTYLGYAFFVYVSLIVVACSVSDEAPAVAEPVVDPVDEVIAEEDAEDDHEQLRPCVFNAIVGASENTPFHRPRDEYTIETGRDTHFSMDGLDAVHEFEIDYDGTLDSSMIDYAIREIQRGLNKHAPRWPLIIREGHPPLVYDLKDTGNFLILEVILYSSTAEEKVKARRKARIARQQRQETIIDSDYSE